jgi:4'-phosphopantetheinyl transferase EntD
MTGPDVAAGPGWSKSGSASCREVLPPQVECHELRGEDCLGSYQLIGGEEGLIERAIPRRRAEFGAVRHCARQALSCLGHYDVAVLSDENGAPLWPEGIVGSMTHATGYCAAAVTSSLDFCSVGIDAEEHRALSEDVLDLVSSHEERLLLRTSRAFDERICWDAVLFSSKEAVYKTWYPLMHRWLGFDDVLVEIDAKTSRFIARILHDPLLVRGRAQRELEGRYVVDAEIIITAVTV